MSRKYYSIAHVVNNSVESDFGSYSKAEVDFGEQDFKDHGAKRSELRRITWSKVPTPDQ